MLFANFDVSEIHGIYTYCLSIAAANEVAALNGQSYASAHNFVHSSLEEHENKKSKTIFKHNFSFWFHKVHSSPEIQFKVSKEANIFFPTNAQMHQCLLMLIRESTKDQKSNMIHIKNYNQLSSSTLDSM